MRLSNRLLLLTPLIGFLGVLSLLPAAARTPDRTPRKIQLSLFNDAAVPQDVIAAAQIRASSVLEKAGAEAEWLTCRPTNKADFSPASPECGTFAWPVHLSVRIVRRGTSVSDNVFGMSFLNEAGEGVYAIIYYENLLDSNGYSGLSNADMLGYAIVHEIGHLLLGLHSHATHGVMQAKWQKATFVAASQGRLVFTEPEANLIQDRLEHVSCRRRLARQAENLAYRDASLFSRRIGFPAAFF